MSPFPADVPEPWLGLLLSPGMRIAAFLWGLLWGSFANVLIYRMPRGMSFVRPRSRCPHCENPVAAYDNIPVLSFLILRGRCRHCKEPLSLRYLIVELLTGILSFALYMKFVYVPLLQGQAVSVLTWVLWFAFGLALLVVTYIDLDFWIIPRWLVGPLAGVGVVAALIEEHLLGVPWTHAVAAGVGGFALFAGIRFLYLRFRGLEGLGLGDAWLLLMVGAFTGPVGLMWTIAAGALQGVIISVPLLKSGKKVANTKLHDVHGDDPELGEEDPDSVTKQAVPFGPFLALAAMEYVLLQDRIQEWLTWWVSGAGVGVR